MEWILGIEPRPRTHMLMTKPQTQAVTMAHMIDLSPLDAWAMLQSNTSARLLDVRMEIEFLYVGAPPGAINVPWYEYPELEVDAARFVQAVKRELPDLNTPVLLLCRSAKRTIPAGAALEAAGYAQVFNITKGFEGDANDNGHRSTINGWRFDGLPWVQT
jgi:rhodanese-related sulfurtransferase